VAEVAVSEGGCSSNCCAPPPVNHRIGPLDLEQETRKKIMTKSSYFFAATLALLFVTASAAQHPVLDAVANKVVAKYQSSTCQQLMQQKAQNKPPSPGEQKAMEMLRTDPEMRHEFVGIVADQVVDKLIQCGMIP
jgi:hypothetical protein